MPEHAEYQDVYDVSYTLANDSPKPIKLIDASVTFSDALGEQFYGIRLDKDVAVQPGKEQSFEGEYTRNQFEPQQARLATMNKADVVAKLIVRAIVFGDNAVAKYGP
jgi:hypothetical protein